MPTADNPLVGTGHTQDQTIAALSKVLNPEGQSDAEAAPAKDNPEQEAKPENPRDDESGKYVSKEPDASAEDAESDAELEGQDEEVTLEAEPAESEDDDLEELPGDIKGLAEAIGIDEKEFTSNMMVEVKLNGKVEKVSLSEALDGYQRIEDYRTKTADLSEQRKADTVEREAIAAERKHYAEQLGPFIQQATQAMQQDDVRLGEMLDINSANYNPEGYVREKARLDGEKVRLDAARQEHDRINQVQSEEGHKAFLADVAEHEKALIEAIPEWGIDSDKATRDLNEIRAYAVSQGVPKELADNEFRSSTLLIARKAMLFDQLQAKAPEAVKKVRKLPKVLKAGAKKDRVDPNVAQHRVNMNRLRKSGSVTDTTEVLKSMNILNR